MTGALPPPPTPPAGPAGPAADGDDGRHPSVETLGAHLRGELPPAEADRVREHVTGCGECIDLLLDLDAFEGRDGAAEADGAAGDGGAGPAAERAESWRRLAAERPWEATARPPADAEPARPQPAHTEAAHTEPAHTEAAHTEAAHPQPAPPERLRTAPAPPPRAPAGERRRPRRPLWRPALVAASLAAAVLCGAWALHLQQRLAAPVPDLPVVDLLPVSVTRGGGQGEALDVPPGAPFAAVIVPDSDRPFARYEAEIVDAGGRRVWAGALRPADPTAPYSPLSLGLSRRLLSDRRYSLRLWGIDAGTRTPAGEYAIELGD